MIKELQVASKIICKRLRERPYKRNVTITAWQATVEQMLDGRRSGTFSWRRCVSDEVDRYIDEMDDETKLAIWNSTEDADLIPDADLETITKCLYPHVFHSVRPAIFRAVKRREKIESDQDGVRQ